MSLRQRVIVLRPPRIAMSLVAAAAVVHLMFPWLILRPSWVGGLLLGAAGFSIMLRAWWLFRQAQTPICPTDVATTLLTQDVYRLSRNPMYLGIVMMMFAVALAFGTLPFFLAAATLFAILNFAFCPYEEGRLRAAFPAYGAYAARVRRWI
jgi:protein-S-isoprenylcysteine O-methyltransferase Ste14